MNAENEQMNFNHIAPKLRALIKKEFPSKDHGLRVIAEPGRFICQAAMSIAMKITLAKEAPGGRRVYFVDSGIYQSLGCTVFDKELFKGQLLVGQKELDKRSSLQRISSIWG